MNLREHDGTTPEAFGRLLRRSARQAWEHDAAALVRLLGGLSFSVPGIGALHVPLRWPEEVPTTLQAMMDAVMHVASDATTSAPGSTQPLPVIIIDEANMLRMWKDETALVTLFAFFVALTKEKQRAHVVLGTSDTFLTHWLDSYGVWPVFRRVLSMGDLAEAEARDFFVGHVLPRFPRSPPFLPDEHWAAVFGACGGNPGALRSVATEGCASGSWAVAAAALLYTAEQELRMAMWPDAAARFSGANFRAAASAIAVSPHGTLRCTTLFGMPDAGGPVAVRAMQEANLLLQRTYHITVRDLPEAAFRCGAATSEDVFMLATTAHLAAARQRPGCLYLGPN